MSEFFQVMWVVAALLVVATLRANATSCTEAQTRCAYRTGCGYALNNYMYLCSEVLSEPTTTCPKPCEHALIALTSTEEGKELMNVRKPVMFFFYIKCFGILSMAVPHYQLFHHRGVMNNLHCVPILKATFSSSA